MGHEEPFKVRKRDGDEGGEAPSRPYQAPGRLVAHVVMRELCYGLKEPNLPPAGRGHDREGLPSVAFSSKAQSETLIARGTGSPR